VWEVQASGYHVYPAGAHAPHKDLTGGWTPWRGGSWYMDETYVRCGARNWDFPDIIGNYSYGFRIVLAPPLAQMS